MWGYEAKRWSELDKLRLGRWGEQFAAMALMRRGFDVYVPFVDDRSIDLLVRFDGDERQFAELQVKTVRLGKAPSYAFMRKRLFPINDSRYLALVVIADEGSEPALFLIPSSVWATPKAPFSSRDFEGKKSDPEYGISISRTTLPMLAPYQLCGGGDRASLEALASMRANM